MIKALLAFVVAVVFAATALTALAAEPQEEIALPNGHLPEGIEVAGHTFYAGSRRDGSVYAGDVRTGEGDILVPGVAGRAATGLKFDRGRLFVSGAGTGNAFVYDAKTGEELESYAFATAPTLHQRRRRDEGRGLVHRLAEAGAVPRRTRTGRRARVIVHDGPTHR